MGRLRHWWSRPRLDAFVDGELRRVEARRVARHVDECPDCTRLVLLTRRLKASLRSLDHGRPPDLAVARLRQFAATVDR